MAKNDFCMHIYTKVNIRDVVYAEKILGVFREENMEWSSMGNVEPLCHSYSDQLFIQYWKSKKVAGIPGKSLGYYSNVMCKQKETRLSLAVGWKENCFDPYSYLRLSFGFAYMKKNFNSIDRIFLRLINILKPECAYIANDRFWFACRGSMNTTPLAQDIHWITYLPKAKYSVLQSLETPKKVIDCCAGKVVYLCDYIPKDNDAIEAECKSLSKMIANAAQKDLRSRTHKRTDAQGDGSPVTADKKAQG